MNRETENYIILKPIAERFNRVASEITDEDIKYIIKDVMKDRIASAINFDTVTEKIDKYIDNNSDKIAHAVMDSLAKRLELPPSYKFY